MILYRDEGGRFRDWGEVVGGAGGEARGRKRIYLQGIGLDLEESRKKALERKILIPKKAKKERLMQFKGETHNVFHIYMFVPA